MKNILKAISRAFQKYGLYCLGIVIIVLNVSLAFDNVVWGDEAFSGNTIYNTSLYGIFQKIYYWDSHPPLYYYWLRLVADILGYKTYVYHMASLIPFVVGIILALTVFRKNLGKIPVAFFIVLSGLSASCVEYNLEIRMYALLFLEILVCVFCFYKLTETWNKKSLWIILTIFGVLAAYTHYYGLVVSGIIIFTVMISDFILNRKIIRGISAIVAYIILYMPWLCVFISQVKRVGSSWWMTEIAPLSVLTEMMFCGKNLEGILKLLTIVLTLFIFFKESEIVYLTIDNESSTIKWHISKPNTKKWSRELFVLLMLWLVVVLTIAFTYAISLLLSPLTVARYMYPLVPVILFILMLCVRRILAYGHIKWGDEEYGTVNEEKKDKQVFLVNPQSEILKKVIFAIVSIVFCVILLISLLDFKYFRSVSKTQEFQTQKVLSIIGEPSDDAVFTATGVKHLSWTVLYYYFPEHEIMGYSPNEVDSSENDIWAFVGAAMSDENMLEMKEKGYSVDIYMDLWMGQYGCNLYHFYK